jgi:hypothetical protein
LEVKKVEKPRSSGERIGERKQKAPAERGKLKEAPAERGRPQQTAPPEKGKPKASPPEKDKSKEAPHDNVLRENPRGGTEREGEKGRR